MSCPVKAITSFNAYLSPEEVSHFSNETTNKRNLPVEHFRSELGKGFPGDPHPLKDLPFLTNQDHKWYRFPDAKYLEEKLHKVTVYNDGRVGFSKPDADPKTERRFVSAPRVARVGGENDISVDNIKAKSKERPLLVDPYAAVLAVYNKAVNPSSFNKVTESDFDAMQKANKAVADFIRKAGREDSKLDNFFGMAVMMDTASRTPALMSSGLIEHMMKFYADYAKEHKSKMWVGAGSEHLETSQQGEGAISKGAVTKENYITARKKQIDKLAELNNTVGLGADGEKLLEPIIFPAIEQNGLSAAENISIALELGNYAVSKGMRPIMHKLGSPFVPATDYVTDEIVRGGSAPYQAVKSSVPLMNKLDMAGFEAFSGQKEDYFAASDQLQSKLYTGDDRNFGMVWLWAAKRELEQAKARITEQIEAGTFEPGQSYINSEKPKQGILQAHSRNGFTFLKGINANALLGYIGLNPSQTANAIIELSNWFYDSLDAHALAEYARVNGNPDNSSQRVQAAEKHLNSYLQIILPAMGMSTHAFFSQYNPTPSYTDYVTAAHKIAGVDLGEGRPLPHRRMIGSPDDTINQKRVIGQQLAWQFLSGTHDFALAQAIVDAAAKKGLVEKV
jgi:hypothetical protein